MDITIFGPSVWRPAVARALNKAPEAPPAATRGLIRFMHDRHVGLAPLPAARLAILLVGDGRPGGADWANPKASEPWATLVDRLVAAATPDETGGHAARLSRPRRLASLRLGLIPAWSVVRIAMPLVARACRLLGRCYLFGGHGHFAPRKADRVLQLYEYEQLELLRHLAGSDDEMPDLFWDLEGLAAGSLTRGAAVPALRDYPRRQPSLDRSAFALLWRLRPVLSQAFDRGRSRMPKAARPALGRQAERLKEEGVAGIRISRRLDDVEELLHSEHLNAGLLLLDRLVNTGFLIRHRPPPRRRRRDVLIVGLMPDPAHGPACALAKAAWFELALRLGLVFQGAALHRSDFVWIEAGPLGGLRFHDADLDSAPAAPLARIGSLPQSFRLQALIELGWIPRFLDRKVAFASVLAPPEAGNRDDGNHGSTDAATRRLDAFAGWMAGALGQVLRTRRAAGSAAGASDSPDVESGPAGGLSDYQLVHGIVCWPFQPALDEERSGESDLGRLSVRLGLGPERGRSLSLLRVPERPRDLAAWRLTAGRRFGTAIMPGSNADAGDPPPQTAELAAALVGAWLDAALEALFGD